MSEAVVETNVSPRLNPAKKRIMPNSMIGMLIFITTEIMFFAAFISAFLIVKSGAYSWPPFDQPRLPVRDTAFNSAFLILSAVFIFLGNRAYLKQSMEATKRFIGVALACGISFVVLQGFEWVGLIKYGLTLTSSNYGGFFYLIVGVHALHAFGAILFLGVSYLKLLRGTMDSGNFWAAQAFWYFVVAVWPILYVLVYMA